MRTRILEGCERFYLGHDGGWYLEVPLKEDENGRKQGFLFRQMARNLLPSMPRWDLDI